MEKLNEDDSNRRLVAFEAFDVLCDPFWREMYDQYGYRAIKLGVFVENENFVKRYSYHGDIFSTYKSVYGSTNPHAHIISMLSNVKVTLNNGRKPVVRRIPIDLTLNEIFFGTLKKINVPKRDGSQNIVNIKIPKGLPVKSEIVHNLTDGRTVIFETTDLPHKHFERSGYDLICTFKVTLKEIILGGQYVIKTLDHKTLRINITQAITPTYQKIIQGEGMPFYQQNCDRRGDIILRFEIQLPLYINSVKNKEICGISSETNFHKMDKKFQSMIGKQYNIFKSCVIK